MATTTPEAFGAGLRARAATPLGNLATAAVLAALGLAVTARLPTPTPVSIIAVVGILAATIWMLCSERYEWTLVVLMLYLGLADGVLKLVTDSQPVTLVRDLLFYAIVVGAMVRMIVRRRPLVLPPLSGWVIAWVIVVLVQIANPHDGTLLHSVASVRPHAEWVPLFFLGFFVMRSRKRLRGFLLLLLVIAAANGIVGLIQLNLTPDQLSSWGPGYAKAIGGEASVSQRIFIDEEGEEKNRPFGLGSDMGFGGAVGVLAVPALLAFLSLPMSPPARLGLAGLAVGVVLAVLTSEARVHVVTAVLAVIAFGVLTLTSRVGGKTLIGIVLGLTIAVGAIAFVISEIGEGSFSRYSSIASPRQAVVTAYEYRGGVIAEVPDYVADIPFGAGIGSRGPGGSFGGAEKSTLNGESEPTYLLIELGVPGLAVMLGFNLVLFYLSLTKIRLVDDRETRIMLAAVAAPLFALFAGWIAGVATATTPGAPYLWFAAGILSYWLVETRKRAVPSPSRGLPTALTPRGVG
ncbi:MAG TPA: hypothetical protein VHA76_00815 [Solirubrobacterales bacterium]|nr:hypothetical protein [Solirubrobacterales bacterium]